MQEKDIKYIKILSDSQAAIKALNSPIIKSKSVLNALEYMENLALNVNHLTLAWIKAHVGTEGNEQADMAAKEETAGGANTSKINAPIPWQIVKNKIQDYTTCLLYTSPSPRDRQKSRMPSSA